jgi:mannose-6-phosphate isomerase-like protein (cupin superfamily)
MPFDQPVTSAPDSYRYAGNGRGGRGIIHLTAAETGGALGMWESHPAPGSGPSWHMHTRETETFRVFAGVFRYWWGDRTLDVGPGGVIALPPHVPHQWRNVSDVDGHIIGIVTPGGFEQFFLELERLGNPTADDVRAINEWLGVVDYGLAGQIGREPAG